MSAKINMSEAELSGGLSGRVIAACFALASFAVAIMAGLASDNPAGSVLIRAVAAMLVCYPLGMLVGLICQQVITSHLREHRALLEAVEVETSPAQAADSASEEQPLIV